MLDDHRCTHLRHARLYTPRPRRSNLQYAYAHPGPIQRRAEQHARRTRAVALRAVYHAAGERLARCCVRESLSEVEQEEEEEGGG